MTSLAVDRDFVYWLDDNGLTRRRIGAGSSLSTMALPVHASPAVEIVASSDRLYVRHQDGAVFARDESFEGGTYEPIAVPVGCTGISVVGNIVYAAVESAIYRLSGIDGVSALLTTPVALSPLLTVRHDEEFAYALTTNSAIWLGKRSTRDWSLYPLPLAQVVAVEAGLDFVYALDVEGYVWRSHVIARSRWERLANTVGIEAFAISSTHADVMWMASGTELIRREAHGWGKVDQLDDAYIDADYIDADYIKVA